MADNEKTSDEIASIAARGLKSPECLGFEEIRSVCASALTQAPDNEPAHRQFVGAKLMVKPMGASDDEFRTVETRWIVLMMKRTRLARRFTSMGFAALL